MSARKTWGGRLALLPFLGVVTIAIGLSACGTDNDPCRNPAGPGCPPSPPPPPPAAAITAIGGGPLVLHPSRDPRFTFAMETPIRISETAGGSADWGYARMQFFNRGVEVERTELTANGIREAGVGRIAANSNQVHKVVFRFNSDDFDGIDLTLGFSDAKDGRQFSVTVPGNTFTEVLLGLDPMSLEHSRTPL